jgi:hypothetical protein
MNLFQKMLNSARKKRFRGAIKLMGFLNFSVTSMTSLLQFKDKYIKKNIKPADRGALLL